MTAKKKKSTPKHEEAVVLESGPTAEPAPAPAKQAAPPPPPPPEQPKAQPVKVKLESLMVEPVRPAAAAPAPSAGGARSLARLDGKTIVVAGGTGAIGSMLTVVGLGAGATVVVPARREDELESLRARLSDTVVKRFIPVVGSFRTADDAATLGKAVASQVARVDGVVSILGGAWEGGPVTEVDVDDWELVLRENLTAPFIAARTFIPLIQQHGKGGSYVIVNNPQSELPALKSAPVSVAGAGLHMLYRILQEELRGKGVRVEELVYSAHKEQSHWFTLDGLMREVLQILAAGTRM